MLFVKRGRRCCVPNCTDKISKRHTLPRNEDLRAEWLKRIYNRTFHLEEVECRRYEVCNKHFEEECLQPDGKIRRGSLPTLLLPAFKRESDEDRYFYRKVVPPTLGEPKILENMKAKIERFLKRGLQDDEDLRKDDEDLRKDDEDLRKDDEDLRKDQEEAEVFHADDSVTDDQQCLRREMCIICEDNEATINIEHLVEFIQSLTGVNIIEFQLPLQACGICVDELDVAYKIRHKIVTRSKQISETSVKNQLIDNPKVTTMNSQTDELDPVANSNGLRLTDLKADNELIQNLIIVQSEKRKFPARSYGTLRNKELDQHSSPKFSIIGFNEDTGTGNGYQMNPLNVEVDIGDFSILSRSEVKSIFTKMSATNKQCIRCYKCFPDTPTLIEHIRKKCSTKLLNETIVDNAESTSAEERTCNKCRSIFRTTLDLNLHNEFDHNNLACPQCQTSYSDSDSISTHRSMHMDEKEVTCEYCDGIITKSTATTHKVAHAWNWWRYSESLCGYCNELVLNDCKYKHRFDCLQKKFVCETCGYVLKTISSLRNHRRKHEKLYKCDICLKDFFKKMDLIRHNQISHIISGKHFTTFKKKIDVQNQTRGRKQRRKKLPKEETWTVLNNENQNVQHKDTTNNISF